MQPPKFKKPFSGRIHWIVAGYLILFVVVIGVMALVLNLTADSKKSIPAAQLAVLPTSTFTAFSATATPFPTPSPTTPLNQTPTPLPTSTAVSRPIINPTPTLRPAPTPAKISLLPSGLLQAGLPDLGLMVVYEPNSFAASHLSEFLANWKEASDYVKERLKLKTAITMTIELRTDGAPQPLGLGVRGFSDVAKGYVYQLYDGSGDSLDRRYITAHEMGHMVAYKKWGAGANLMLIEGLAMYASDEFLRQAGFITLDDFAVAANQQKRLVSIAQLSTAPEAEFNGRLTGRVNYDLAGSFVSWLIETYGLDKFGVVYTTGRYVPVYNKTLEQLNQEWIKFLENRSKNQSVKFDSTTYFGFLDRVSLDYLKLYARVTQNNDRLNQSAYDTIDKARLYLDRLDYPNTEEQLKLFDKQI